MTEEGQGLPGCHTIQGDCLQVMKNLETESFDSVVTDPPYALSFMGKDWDSFGNGKGFQVWCEEWARECLRVLKPGGHLLAFGGTRTYHREVCAIEDAGFEIRDSVHWIYGSGFPKSMDISKAIDKARGAEREVLGLAGKSGKTRQAMAGEYAGEYYETAPATEAAKQWEGWGTALKPAHEPIVMARKPLSEKTVADNVLEYGTGGINIDGCRVESDGSHKRPYQPANNDRNVYGTQTGLQPRNAEGRWPPNVILTHSPDCLDWICALDCPVQEMNRQSRPGSVSQAPSENTAVLMGFAEHDDSGGASRFFPCFRYQAKAPKKERPVVSGVPAHPTVKPLELMKWLVRLVTPPGGIVLDPFAGTGTTGEACLAEGLRCVLIEQNRDYLKLIGERLRRKGVNAGTETIRRT